MKTTTINKGLEDCSTNIEQVQLVINTYRQLEKISRSLRKSYENSCNFPLSKRQQTREDNLQRKAEMLAIHLGLKAYHQTDPRGCALYLIDVDMDETNYDHGIAIY